MKDVQLLVGANEQLSDNDDKDFEKLSPSNVNTRHRGTPNVTQSKHLKSNFVPHVSDVFVEVSFRAHRE